MIQFFRLIGFSIWIDFQKVLCIFCEMCFSMSFSLNSIELRSYRVVKYRKNFLIMLIKCPIWTFETGDSNANLSSIHKRSSVWWQCVEGQSVVESFFWVLRKKREIIYEYSAWRYLHRCIHISWTKRKWNSLKIMKYARGTRLGLL